MTFKQPVIFFCLSLSLLLLLGCGAPKDARHKDLAPASGIVLYKGAPVGGATLVFHNEDSTRQGGSAIAEADGEFTLRTFGGEGTFPGNYTVTVIKDRIVNPISDEELLRLEREGKDLPETKTESLLPAKYRLKTTSPLKITIPAGGDKNLKIELAD
jgi:hypothetical protein